MKPSRDYIKGWNAALDAAAKLVGMKGFTYVRRHLDMATMSNPVEVWTGRAKITGDYDEATRVDPDQMAQAAILSLRRRDHGQ